MPNQVRHRMNTGPVSMTVNARRGARSKARHIKGYMNSRARSMVQVKGSQDHIQSWKIHVIAVIKPLMRVKVE